MPKVPLLKPHQVVRALEKAGFVQARQKGSHLRLKRGNLSVTVPVHPGDLPPNVLRSILRQAHLTLDELLKLL